MLTSIENTPSEIIAAAEKQEVGVMVASFVADGPEATAEALANLIFQIADYAGWNRSEFVGHLMREYVEKVQWVRYPLDSETAERMKSNMEILKKVCEIAH